jgi:serine/threonine-protein kinase
LLDGEELGKRLQRLGRLAPHEVLRIVSQVGRALTKAHSVNIVHRDLKPENIFLVRDDDREIAKVLDFGIAKAAGTGLDGSNTKTGAMLGTPYYMSPEQAQGVKAVDHRSDLWSLGVIVFQALTGRLPFESEALGDLLVRIIVAPVPMPSHFVSDLPAGFDQWWAKASQRDPAHRYQSAKELTDGLLLVFGQSQGEYGAEPRGFGLSGMNQPVPAFARTPGGLGATPRPLGMTPQHLGMTPPPGGPLPQSFGLTPPGHGFGPGPIPTTGAPIAHTFAGVPGPPKSKAGAFIALAGVAVVALVLGVVGVSYAVKGKKDATAAAGTAAAVATPSAVAPPSAAALADPAPHETLAPPAVGDASSATSPPPSSPAPAAVTAKPRGQVPAVPPKPPPAPPAPTKKPHVDLGI